MPIPSRFLVVFSAILFFSTAARASVDQDLASPVTTPAYRVLLAGTATTLALLALEDQIVDPVQYDTVEDHPLGGFAKWGDVAGQMVPNGAYALGMYAFGRSRKGNLMVRATLDAAAVTTVLKHVVREPRPNPRGQRVSFPSGHSTTAFAFAAAVGAVEEWYWGAGAYLLAGLVGYSRMNDNQHYIHDVIGGATIGISYGLGVYFVDRKKGRFPTEDRDTPSVAWFPIVDREGSGLALNLRF